MKLAKNEAINRLIDTKMVLENSATAEKVLNKLRELGIIEHPGNNTDAPYCTVYYDDAGHARFYCITSMSEFERLNRRFVYSDDIINLEIIENDKVDCKKPEQHIKEPKSSEVEIVINGNTFIIPVERNELNDENSIGARKLQDEDNGFINDSDAKKWKAFEEINKSTNAKHKILVELEADDKQKDFLYKSLCTGSAICDEGIKLTRIYMDGYSIKDLLRDIKSEICDKINTMIEANE